MGSGNKPAKREIKSIQEEQARRGTRARRINVAGRRRREGSACAGLGLRKAGTERVRGRSLRRPRVSGAIEQERTRSKRWNESTATTAAIAAQIVPFLRVGLHIALYRPACSSFRAHHCMPVSAKVLCCGRPCHAQVACSADDEHASHARGVTGGSRVRSSPISQKPSSVVAVTAQSPVAGSRMRMESWPRARAASGPRATGGVDPRRCFPPAQRPTVHSLQRVDHPCGVTHSCASSWPNASTAAGHWRAPDGHAARSGVMPDERPDLPCCHASLHSNDVRAGRLGARCHVRPASLLRCGGQHPPEGGQ